MPGRFGGEVEKILIIAKEAAKRLHHDYIGTEHILAGLIRMERSEATPILSGLRLTRAQIARKIDLIVSPGPRYFAPGSFPFTPRSQKVLGYIEDEAGNWSKGKADARHVLVALIREQEGLSAHILMDLGLTEDKIRQEAYGAKPEKARVGKWARGIGITFPGGTELEVIDAEVRERYPEKPDSEILLRYSEYSIIASSINEGMHSGCSQGYADLVPPGMHHASLHLAKCMAEMIRRKSAKRRKLHCGKSRKVNRLNSLSHRLR